MRQTTLVLAVTLFAFVHHDGSVSANERGLRRDDRVRQEGNRLFVTTDVLVNRVFSDADRDQVAQAATRAGQDPAQAVDRARRSQFASRCNLWVTYLEQMSNRSQQLAIQRDPPPPCQEDVRSGTDGNTRHGTLTVQIMLPRGRRVAEDIARTVEFRDGDRYEAWVRCHRAAAQLRGVVTAICQQQDAKQGDKYITRLRVFQFEQQPQ